MLFVICPVQIEPSIRSLHRPLYLNAALGQRQWEQKGGRKEIRCCIKIETQGCVPLPKKLAKLLVFSWEIHALK